MQNKQVLVLGSKPGSELPKFKFDKIYTANGAAERGRIFKKSHPETILNCLVGLKEFEKNQYVKNFITNSNPNRVIFRTGDLKDKDYFSSECKVEILSWKEQLELQKEFVKNGFLSIILGEILRKENILDKIKYILGCFKRNEFWGVSTGLFAIMYALKENPEANIVVSGIGLVGGHQFYKSERSKVYDYFPRARVDRFVSRRINKQIKSRVYSLDDDFIKNFGSNKWSGAIL